MQNLRKSKGRKKNNKHGEPDCRATAEAEELFAKNSCKLYVYTVFSSPKHSYNGSKIIKLMLTYQWWWL